MRADQRRIVIAGTGTEVGKTWLAERLLERARAGGLSVAARKPAQSFGEHDVRTDAELLASASGEFPQRVCPSHRWYSVAMAPPMAADVLGREPILLRELLLETNWPSHIDLCVIETAGGLRSPIAHDADNLALIAALAPDQVVLVADAGLGTLNAVRLCMQALSGFSTTVFLNRYDPGSDLHRRNRVWLTERDGFDVETAVEAVMR